MLQICGLTTWIQYLFIDFVDFKARVLNDPEANSYLNKSKLIVSFKNQVLKTFLLLK